MTSARTQSIVLGGMITTILATSACINDSGPDVRYEPTPMPIVRTMLDMAGVGANDVVFDLGSGDGRVLVEAAARGARGVGIEIRPSLIERARENARTAGVSDRVTVRHGNMYEADIRGATVVALFLHPAPNLKLRPKLQAELAPGTRVVSYMWDMGDWTPDEIRPAGRHRIFLWRIGEPSTFDLRPSAFAPSAFPLRQIFASTGRQKPRPDQTFRP